MGNNKLDDPRVYLAVERTYLAWIRTGLSLMGFGFVVARFGLFLRELNAVGAQGAGATHGISARFGTALVVLGVVLTFSAIVRYVVLLKRLRAGEELTKPSRLGVVLGLTLAVVGGVASVYLVVTAWAV